MEPKITDIPTSKLRKFFDEAMAEPDEIPPEHVTNERIREIIETGEMTDNEVQHCGGCDRCFQRLEAKDRWKIASQTIRFPGHGATCEANDDRGTDFGRCGEPAYTIVSSEGRDYAVCYDHYLRMPQEAK
jgi:hypothetical protein